MRIRAKKYRPPRPKDVKGGCSPQNNLPKLRTKYACSRRAATNFSEVVRRVARMCPTLTRVKLGLRYETTYSYEEPVSFSPHDLRLFPRTERFSRVRRFRASGEWRRLGAIRARCVR